MKILQDEQRKCQTWANVPSMILDPKERQQAKFINNNRCVSDPESFYDFNNDVNIDWTTQERDNFYELFKSFPKKFGKIAEHLKDKSANDCVIYYYQNNYWKQEPENMFRKVNKSLRARNYYRNSYS